MTRWKNSVFAAGAAFGLFAAGCLGLVSGPVAMAQPADAAAAIDAHYSEKGGANSPLGEKVGTVYAFGPNGAAQDFQGGKMIYSPETGAKVMYGAILEKYLALGGAGAGLGYPVNDESDAPVAGTARFSEFSAPDGATIEWSPQHGAWLVQGPIRTAWSHLHATDGALGAPLSDTTVENGVYSQRFAGQNGTPVDIRWSSADGFVTAPPEIAGQLSGLDVSVPGAAPGGQVAAPAPESAPAATDSSSSASKWWALPLGLVIAAVAGGLAAMVAGGARGAHAGSTAAAGTGAGAGVRRAGSHLASAAERNRGIPRAGGV
ncbi:LGFP repeat-containing protein [Nocardia inohanensis]|uniref:LGFP repeat-containing protein n=1 Tax=Nocardia inohanensis TaxID=209246 RepID=UPI000ABD882A|nr:hypothetical protein [Nocardia inohanensis]